MQSRLIPLLSRNGRRAGKGEELRQRKRLLRRLSEQSDIAFIAGRLEVVHDKIVHGGPGEVSGVAIAVQSGVFDAGDARHEGAEKAATVDGGAVEPDAGQDDGVGDFGLFGDGGVRGVGAKGEGEEGNFVGSDLARVFARLDERGELLQDGFGGCELGFEA